MIDIRAAGKEYKKLKKIYDNSERIKKEIVSINEDKNASVPVIMVKNETGELVEFTRGFDNVKQWTQNGFVEIRRSCPMQKFKKCPGMKCGFYIIKYEHMTGDCLFAWQGVQAGLLK